LHIDRPVNATTTISSTGLSPRVAAPLTYLGWWVTGAIFWIVERQDRVVRFHAAQSMAAFGVVAVLIGGFCCFAAASLSFLPAAFAMFLWAAGVTWGAGMLIWLVAMWQAANGKVWRIPLAAQIADRMVGDRRGAELGSGLGQEPAADSSHGPDS
jgi:uncharacterized membrane protein